MTKKLSDRSDNVPSSGIGLMMRYASNYQDVISLGQGTPLFPTPEFIYESVYQTSKSEPSMGQYLLAPLENKLKDLIATEMSELYGFQPKREELALTVGGVGGLFAAFLTLLDPGDEIIYFDPSYPIHLSQLALVQAKPVFVHLNEDQGWRLDPQALAAAITPKTKAILLTNPNNPTGTVLTKAEVEAIVAVVAKNDLYLVLDEAYYFLSYDLPVLSSITYPEIRDKIVLIKSFSKEYAMTGWRLGYVYANQELLARINNDVDTYTCISPSTIAVYAAIVALSDPRGKIAMNGFIAEFKKSRETICRRMDKLAKLFSYTKPEGAYYLFPKLIAFPELTAVDFCKKLVAEAGVITIPGDSSGPSGARHIRMSFAANSELIDKAFDRLDQFAEKYQLL